MNAPEIFAQIETTLGPVLLQFGLPGVVLAWFMFRTEGKLASMERAIDRLSKASLLLVVSNRESNQATKDQARSLLEELNQKQPTD